MSRENALLLAKIHKIEKERGRGIYPEELASFQICSSRQCRHLIDLMLADGYMIESVVDGANVYSISNIGKAHLEAYLDIRREM